eukprot:1600301-Rhodomonas_salina.1
MDIEEEDIQLEEDAITTKAFHTWLLDLCIRSICLSCEGTLLQFMNVVGIYARRPVKLHGVMCELKALRVHELCTRDNSGVYSININLLRAHHFDLCKKGLYPHMRE